MKKTKKVKIPIKFYKEVFDALMYLGTHDKKMTKSLLNHLDNVADYLGDVFTGRIK